MDQDIKEQIAALVNKQKERNAERARSLSRDSEGSSAGPSGTQAEETEQMLDKRVSNGSEATGLFTTTRIILLLCFCLLKFKSLEKKLRNVGDDVRKH